MMVLAHQSTFWSSGIVLIPIVLYYSLMGNKVMGSIPGMSSCTQQAGIAMAYIVGLWGLTT
jgi:hypothetical protein